MSEIEINIGKESKLLKGEGNKSKKEEGEGKREINTD